MKRDAKGNLIEATRDELLELARDACKGEGEAFARGVLDGLNDTLKNAGLELAELKDIYA